MYKLKKKERRKRLGRRPRQFRVCIDSMFTSIRGDQYIESLFPSVFEEGQHVVSIHSIGQGLTRLMEYKNPKTDNIYALLNDILY